MRDQKTKTQITIKKKEIIPTPCSPTHSLIWINPPSPPIIHNNNTMDTEFLVEMRQCNKCWSVRNDDIFNLHLGSGAGPWVIIPCLLQDTRHIYWFHPPKQLTTKKQLQLSLSKKKIFPCLNDSPSKMMKIFFYFIIKPLFVLNIFKFLSWLFGHVGKAAWLER